MNQLSETGFLRLPQIIGQEAVTEEQAAENLRNGKNPKRPRPGIPALIPVKKSTWWAWCATGKAPAPLKLSSHITVWRIEAIRTLLEQMAGGAK